LVDFFAPGVKIFSTQPVGNVYGRLDGTSFSGPIVAGIVALIRSYYPALSTTELVQLLQKTVTIPKNSKTCLPSFNKDKTPTDWKSLSKTGGIVNAYQAIKAADEFIQLKSNPETRLKK
jgi:subtilisin family serine protease